MTWIRWLYFHGMLTQMYIYTFVWRYAMLRVDEQHQIINIKDFITYWRIQRTCFGFCFFTARSNINPSYLFSIFYQETYHVFRYLFNISPEFLIVTVSPSCDSAKVYWLCATFWELYVQREKFMIFTIFIHFLSVFTHFILVYQ